MILTFRNIHNQLDACRSSLFHVNVTGLSAKLSCFDIGFIGRRTKYLVAFILFFEEMVVIFGCHTSDNGETKMRQRNPIYWLNHFVEGKEIEYACRARARRRKIHRN